MHQSPAASVFASISTGDEATSILGISGLLKDCKNSKEETEPRFPTEHGRLHKGAVTTPICSSPKSSVPRPAMIGSFRPAHIGGAGDTRAIPRINAWRCI